MRATFDRAMAFTLRWEGGEVNDPADPGGHTKYGISQRAYPDLDIANLTLEDAHAIYRKDYWVACSCDDLPAGLDIITFDAAVNTGVTQATRFLQRALKVDADGKIGPVTRRAAGLVAVKPLPAMIDCLVQRAEYYHHLVERKPELGKFMTGWLRRTVSLTVTAAEIAASN